MVEVIVQCCERGNRDREVVSPDDRLQICQAAGEWVDRDHVPIARGRSRRQSPMISCNQCVCGALFISCPTRERNSPRMGEVLVLL